MPEIINQSPALEISPNPTVSEQQVLPEQSLTFRERIAQRIRDSRIGRFVLVAGLSLISTGAMEAIMNAPSASADGNTPSLNLGSVDYLYSDGTVVATDNNEVDPAINYGSPSNYDIRGKAVGISAVQGGYYVADSRGDAFAFGNAVNYGSAGNLALNKPVVGIETTSDGQGYWEVAADGGVFAYGDAGFYGSAANVNLNAPVVGIAATPDNKGYWEVAADGGVFAYGDAAFYGSASNNELNQPIVSITSEGSEGYTLTAKDGGIFTFGNVEFAGSVPLYDAEHDLFDTDQSVGLLQDKTGDGYTVYDSAANDIAFGLKTYAEEQNSTFLYPDGDIVAATIASEPAS